MTSRKTTTTALVAIALAAAGCGGAGESTADRYAAQAEREARTQTTAAATPATPVEAQRATPSAGERDIDSKPKIPDQEGEAPTELVAKDLIVGDGETAADGDTVKVDYVGVLFDGGKEFDSSWGEGKEDFEFTLGAGNVIDGWDQGVAGMKVGGRRQLVIPPDLAYGAAGQPPDIPANAALVFDVDLRDVTKAQG
jgi:peptidylprolyl isomerase